MIPRASHHEFLRQTETAVEWSRRDGHVCTSDHRAEGGLRAGAGARAEGLEKQHTDDCNLGL
jgi:hypothetical protein